ncbi:MAG: sigma-54-dependent Fis family transcriptional regulator [Ignavibacteriales bacterium]|nr:MAG: sigma-54-dependent Fis family transcriptional regulator [Ignavibacteriales bacterium]
MSNSTEAHQQFQKKMGESISRLSASFLELSSELKSNSISTELQKKVDRIFKLFMEHTQSINSDVSGFIEKNGGLERTISNLLEEKRKLEVLYSSGIVFSSGIEKQMLMETAIDTVVKELKADAGFIIIKNAQGEDDSVFAKNMNPEGSEAMQLSTTVISNTIKSISPVRVDNAAADEELSSKNSIIQLGISAVLCVPLVNGSNVIGAVYIDRRNKENPFTHSDLLFLLSFAKQIVKGLEISIEISSLEKKILTDAITKFEDLRKEFNCENIIGRSSRLFEVLKISAKISSTDASVVLLGENGTGKDVLARTIHQNSKRSGKPFVTIDCGSIPSDLLESELFGYESGAFTGATKSKPGKLELADGGTLFFDEIGEMNINLQAKLLRVIQTREIERLGSVITKKIDVRIICATNKNIAELIAKGQFREDLYYRLKVIELTMPPLRERREDIEELANHFLKKHSQDGKTFKLSEDVLEILEEYNWPGNIRELENIILRCVVLAKDEMIGTEDLPPEIIGSNPPENKIPLSKTLLDAETEFRKMYIIKTLRKCKSKAEAAEMLGINRTHFYKLLAQLDIQD